MVSDGPIGYGPIVSVDLGAVIAPTCSLVRRIQRGTLEPASSIVDRIVLERASDELARRAGG